MLQWPVSSGEYIIPQLQTCTALVLSASNEGSCSSYIGYNFLEVFSF